jgi:hypothetical protein
VRAITLLACYVVINLLFLASGRSVASISVNGEFYYYRYYETGSPNIPIVKAKVELRTVSGVLATKYTGTDGRVSFTGVENPGGANIFLRIYAEGQYHVIVSHYSATLYYDTDSRSNSMPMVRYAQIARPRPRTTMKRRSP